jgi:hypothetical protein
MGTLAAVCEAVPLPAEQGLPSGGQAQPVVAAPTWNALLVGADVFGLLQTALASSLEDDALLEAAALTGALAGHEALASQLAESGAVSMLAPPACVTRMFADLDMRRMQRWHCVHRPLSQLQALAALMGQRFQDDEFVLQARGGWLGAGCWVMGANPLCAHRLQNITLEGWTT